MNDNSPPVILGKPDRTYAIVAHIGGIFFSFIPSLIVYLMKKSEPGSAFDVDHAKEALNFQITMMVAFLTCFMLSTVLIGLFMFPLVTLANVVFCILAAVKASDGQAYRYPLALRFVQ